MLAEHTLITEKLGDAHDQATKQGLVSVGGGNYAPKSATTMVQRMINGAVQDAHALKKGQKATHKIINRKLVKIELTGEKPSRPTDKLNVGKLAQKLKKGQSDIPPDSKVGIEIFQAPEAQKILKNGLHALTRSGDIQKFLNKPTTASGQQLVRKYGLKYGNNKLYADLPTPHGKPFGERPIGRQLGLALTQKLAELGVDISMAREGTVELAGEFFKPTRLYAHRERQILEVAGRGANAVQIGKDTLKRFNSQDETTYVDKWMRAYQKQNPTATVEESNDVEDMLHQIIQSHNDKLVKLSTLNGQEVVALNGTDGTRRLKRKLIERVNELSTTKGLPEEEASAINVELNRLFTSRTQSEYMQRISSVMGVLESSGLKSAMPIISESLAQGLFLMGGDTVYVPMSDIFELADLIAINPKGVENPLDVINKIKFVQTVAHTSVKKDKGNASTTGPRINLSTFYQERYPTIVNDLTRLTSVTTKGLWSDDKMLRRETEAFVTDIFDRYEDSIREYFGINETVSSKQLRTALSRGARPKCRGGILELPSQDGSPLNQGDVDGKPVDQRAWRHYSLAGLMMEAVHNKHVHRQNYTTLNVGKKGIKQSNGITSLTRVEFQFYKGKGAKPDQNMGSWSTVSNGRKNIRDGNPCSKRSQSDET
jgi:hypothetical protein